MDIEDSTSIIQHGNIRAPSISMGHLYHSNMLDSQRVQLICKWLSANHGGSQPYF